jgi:hypothetical protein
VFLRARLLDDAAESLEADQASSRRPSRPCSPPHQPQLAAQVLERIIVRLRRRAASPGCRACSRPSSTWSSGPPARSTTRAARPRTSRPGSSSPSCSRTTARRRCSGSASSTATPSTATSTPRSRCSRLAQAAQAAKQARDRILELRIANRRAEILLGAGEIEQAVRCSKEAMEILEIPEAQDTHACHIIGTRLRCLSLAGQLTEARRLHDSAKPLAARVSVLQRQSYISGIAYLAVLGNEPERAIPETRQAIEQLRAVNITRMLISPLHNIGDLLLRSGDLEAAAEAFKEALRLAGLHGHTYQIHLNAASSATPWPAWARSRRARPCSPRPAAASSRSKTSSSASTSCACSTPRSRTCSARARAHAASSRRCSPTSSRPASCRSRSGPRRPSAASSATAAPRSSRPPRSPSRQPASPDEETVRTKELR